MRYVRCRECGSPEVPALATCPACGIKTDVVAGRPWVLLAVVVALGLGAGVALGTSVFAPRHGGDATATTPPPVKPERGTTPRPDAALQRKIDDLTKANKSLQDRLTEMMRRPTGVAPTPTPTPRPEGPVDSRLRVAHVRWILAYLAASRVWQAPYVPMATARGLDAAVATLDTRTRELAAAAAAAAPEGAAWLQESAIKQFADRLAAFKQAATRPRQVTVNANEDWHSSDVNVAAGDLVYLSAHGTWQLSVPQVTEDGTPVPAVTAPLVASAPFGAVLCRVRGSETTHDVVPSPGGEGTGETITETVDAAGPLEFRPNDQDLQGNTGSVTVDVLVLPKAVVTPLEAAGKALVGE